MLKFDLRSFLFARMDSNWAPASPNVSSQRSPSVSYLPTLSSLLSTSLLNNLVYNAYVTSSAYSSLNLVTPGLAIWLLRHHRRSSGPCLPLISDMSTAADDCHGRENGRKNCAINSIKSKNKSTRKWEKNASSVASIPCNKVGTFPFLFRIRCPLWFIQPLHGSVAYVTLSGQSGRHSLYCHLSFRIFSTILTIFVRRGPRGPDFHVTLAGECDMGDDWQTGELANPNMYGGHSCQIISRHIRHIPHA